MHGLHRGTLVARPWVILIRLIRYCWLRVLANVPFALVAEERFVGRFDDIRGQTVSKFAELALQCCLRVVPLRRKRASDMVNQVIVDVVADRLDGLDVRALGAGHLVPLESLRTPLIYLAELRVEVLVQALLEAALMPVCLIITLQEALSDDERRLLIFIHHVDGILLNFVLHRPRAVEIQIAHHLFVRLPLLRNQHRGLMVLESWLPLVDSEHFHILILGIQRTC